MLMFSQPNTAKLLTNYQIFPYRYAAAVAIYLVIAEKVKKRIKNCALSCLKII